jgi:UDP-N-acetylglucosamine pyrophosphorylase
MVLNNELAIVILAAGKGTRMKSELPKVLHTLNAKSMILYIVECAAKMVGNRVVVVIGHQAEKVKKVVEKRFKVSFAYQKELLGTGDAVLSAFSKLDKMIREVLVLYGDVPLIQKETLQKLINHHQDSKSKVTILTVDVDHPSGYGRVITDFNGNVLCVREDTDASDAEKKIKKINTGIYCFNRVMLDAALNRIKPDNKQAEYYLTDVIGIVQKNGGKISTVNLTDSTEVMGINTLEELKKAEVLVKQQTE